MIVSTASIYTVSSRKLLEQECKAARGSHSRIYISLFLKKVTIPGIEKAHMMKERLIWMPSATHS